MTRPTAIIGEDEVVHESERNEEVAVDPVIEKTEAGIDTGAETEEIEEIEEIVGSTQPIRDRMTVDVMMMLVVGVDVDVAVASLMLEVDVVVAWLARLGLGLLVAAAVGGPFDVRLLTGGGALFGRDRRGLGHATLLCVSESPTLP